MTGGISGTNRNQRKVYGAALAIAVTAGLLLARLAVAPTADGYRHAIAPAPNGDLYAVEGGRALLVGREGGARLLGATGQALPLALAADGERLVLGTDAGVEVSSDGGAAWRAAALPRGHYPAVWVVGGDVLAGRWGADVWRSTDGGASWRSLGSAGGGEYTALLGSAGLLFAATLTGVWVTPDGRGWDRAGTGTRVTALSSTSDGTVLAGDWTGGVYSVFPVAGPRSSAGAAVWALVGRKVATTDGVRDGSTVALRGREVTALVSAGGRLYAGVARGPVLVSTDAGASWRRVLDG